MAAVHRAQRRMGAFDEPVTHALVRLARRLHHEACGRDVVLESAVEDSHGRLDAGDEDRVCHDLSTRREYCGPLEYTPTADTLYRNQGDGTFQDVSAEAGIDHPASGLGVVCLDFNQDARSRMTDYHSVAGSFKLPHAVARMMESPH